MNHTVGTVVTSLLHHAKHRELKEIIRNVPRGIMPRYYLWPENSDAGNSNIFTQMDKLKNYKWKSS